MLDSKPSSLLIALAALLFCNVVSAAPSYPTGYVNPYPVTQILQPNLPNNYILEAMAHDIYGQRRWFVDSGYVQPVASPYAPGYQTYPSLGSYKVHKYGASWHDAMNACAAEGSTLAIVTSQAEADLVKSYFNGYDRFPGAASNQRFWIGAQERGVNGQFYTIVGVRLELSGYEVWSRQTGQPNDPGNGDCVNIAMDGSYFDDVCTMRLAFVCEKFVN